MVISTLACAAVPANSTSPVTAMRKERILLWPPGLFTKLPFAKTLACESAWIAAPALRPPTSNMPGIRSRFQWPPGPSLIRHADFFASKRWRLEFVTDAQPFGRKGVPDSRPIVRLRCVLRNPDEQNQG